MRTTTTTTSWPFLFFLYIFAFSTTCSLVLAVSVHDSEGNDLRTGVNYYILPSTSGTGGGGVTLGNNIYKNSTLCTLDVTQELTETSDGIQVIFSSAKPEKDGIISLSTDLNIEYNVATTCKTSLVWRLANFDQSTKQTFITTGGLKGNPGPQTLRNWFKIERIDGEKDGVYKLVYCPSVCEMCRPNCKDMSIYVDKDGWRRLTLSSDDVAVLPLKVIFTKM